MNIFKKVKLRLLFCFGIILFASLVVPTTAKAHSSQTNGRQAYDIGRATGTIYDALNGYWNKKDRYVGWFCHDKEVSPSSSAKWYTKGYYITFKKISSASPAFTKEGGNSKYPFYPGVYILKENAVYDTSWDCTQSGYVDVPWVFDEDQISEQIENYVERYRGTKQEVKLDTDANGITTVYAQAVIGVMDKRYGKWVDTGEELTSLVGWKTKRAWANTSTFKNHYNIPIRIKAPASIQTKYVTLESGKNSNGLSYDAGVPLYYDKNKTYGKIYADDLSSGVQYDITKYGFVEKRSRTKLTTKVNGSDRRLFVLTGIKIQNSEDKNPLVWIQLDPKEVTENVVRRNVDYKVVVKSCINSDKYKKLSNKKVQFGEKNNFFESLASYLKKFECGSPRSTITYYYSEFNNEYQLHAGVALQGLADGYEDALAVIPIVKNGMSGAWDNKGRFEKILSPTYDKVKKNPSLYPDFKMFVKFKQSEDKILKYFDDTFDDRVVIKVNDKYSVWELTGFQYGLTTGIGAAPSKKAAHSATLNEITDETGKPKTITVQYFSEEYGKYAAFWSDPNGRNTRTYLKSITINEEESGDYAIYAQYKVKAPQIELFYYKDGAGALHLISQRTGGAELVYNDDETEESMLLKYKTNTYGATNSSTGKVIKRSTVNVYNTYSWDTDNGDEASHVAYDGTPIENDIVLYKAFAYQADGIDTIKGYNNSSADNWGENCWSITNYNALRNKYVKKEVLYNQGNVGTNAKWLTSGTNSILECKGEIGITPQVYVFIYAAETEDLKSSVYTIKDGATTQVRAVQGGTFTCNGSKCNGKTYNNARTVKHKVGEKTMYLNDLFNQDGTTTKTFSDGGGTWALEEVYVIADKNAIKARNLAKKGDLASIQKLFNKKKYKKSFAFLDADDDGNSASLSPIKVKAGQVTIIKVYRQTRNVNVWTVSYLDKEDGSIQRISGGEFNGYPTYYSKKNSYIRIKQGTLETYQVSSGLKNPFKRTLTNKTVGGQAYKELDLSNVGYIQNVTDKVHYYPVGEWDSHDSDVWSGSKSCSCMHCSDGRESWVGSRLLPSQASSTVDHGGMHYTLYSSWWHPLTHYNFYEKGYVSDYAWETKYFDCTCPSYWTYKDVPDYDKDGKITGYHQEKDEWIVVHHNHPYRVWGEQTKHSIYANQHFALSTMLGLEGVKTSGSLDLSAQMTSKGSITWAVHVTSNNSKATLNMNSVDNVLKGIDLSQKTWVFGVYKPAKSYFSASVVETEDDKYKVLADYSETELTPYTFQATVSYEPYVVEDDVLYKLDKIKYYYTDETPVLSTDTSSIKNISNFKQVTYTEEGICSNYSNSPTLDIDGTKLHVVGVYKEYLPPEQTPSEPKITKEIISYRDTVGGKPIDSSWNNAALALETQARFAGAIVNDTEYSSDMLYDAEQGIPTSEYLRTGVKVPKYLVDIDYEKTTISIDYPVTVYEVVRAGVIYTDYYGNEVSVYNAAVLEEIQTITRKNHNYALKGSSVWVPDDATIANYAINEQFDQKIVMFPYNASWINGNLGITAGSGDLNAAFEIPDYTGHLTDLFLLETVIDLGDEDLTDDGKLHGHNEMLARVLDRVVTEKESVWNSEEKKIEREKLAQNFINPILVTNQQVVFNDGAGNTTELLTYTGLMEEVADPVMVPTATDVADVIAESPVFNSKNHNTGSSRYSQNDTYQNQIDLTKSNGLKLSHSAVHYKLHDKDGAGIFYKEDGSVVSYTDLSKVPADVKEYTDRIYEDGLCFGVTVNDVLLLTPVVTNTTIKYQRGWSQAIRTGIGQQLVLDKEFTIVITADGVHSELPGYGAKDYERYIADRTIDGKVLKDVQIKFPFEVLYLRGSGDYVNIPANVWYTIGLSKEGFNFLLPSWVSEGDAQLIRVRTMSLNARANDPDLQSLEMAANANYNAIQESFDMAYQYVESDASDFEDYTSIVEEDKLTTGEDNLEADMDASVNSTGDDEKDELIATDHDEQIDDYSDNDSSVIELADGHRTDATQEDLDSIEWNYVSYQDSLVDVIGRIYGMGIIDVADYPTWESYFRTKGLLNGNRYDSGILDENGQVTGVQAKYTFPIIAGKHPSITNAGYSKFGYTIRYELETVGDMFSANDYVAIKPEFYWVDNQGQNRTKVNVYYDESFGGSEHRLVKIGSDEDKSNKKYYSLADGDFSIDKNILDTTASIMGLTTEEFMNKDTAVYSFDNIMLNQYTRTFVGTLHDSLIDGEYVNVWDWIQAVGDKYAPSADDVDKSVQNWYGEYYLPSECHATTAGDAWVQENCAEDFAYENECWKTDGYLIVKLKIYTINGARSFETDASGNVTGTGMFYLTYNAMDFIGLSDSEEYNPEEADPSGRCNMWDIESFGNKVIASNGVTFDFEDGDFLVYDISGGTGTNNASDDYNSGGTH